MPEADAIVGFDGYADMATTLRSVLQGHRPAAHVPADRRTLLPLTPAARPEAAGEVSVPGHAAPRRRLDDRPWAPLKIASGCDRRCAFCAIPAFRGSFVSRRPTDVDAEARVVDGEGQDTWAVPEGEGDGATKLEPGQETQDVVAVASRELPLVMSHDPQAPAITVDGTAVGLAMRGYRPVAEIQFDGFIYPAFDQIISQVSKMHARSLGQLKMPIVIRIPFGGGIGAVEHHSESNEAYFAHTAGLRVVGSSEVVCAPIR